MGSEATVVRVSVEVEVTAEAVVEGCVVVSDEAAEFEAAVGDELSEEPGLRGRRARAGMFKAGDGMLEP